MEKSPHADWSDCPGRGRELSYLHDAGENKPGEDFDLIFQLGNLGFLNSLSSFPCVWFEEVWEVIKPQGRREWSSNPLQSTLALKIELNLCSCEKSNKCGSMLKLFFWIIDFVTATNMHCCLKYIKELLHLIGLLGTHWLTTQQMLKQKFAKMSARYMCCVWLWKIWRGKVGPNEPMAPRPHKKLI